MSSPPRLASFYIQKFVQWLNFISLMLAKYISQVPLSVVLNVFQTVQSLTKMRAGQIFGLN